MRLLPVSILVTLTACGEGKITYTPEVSEVVTRTARSATAARAPEWMT